MKAEILNTKPKFEPIELKITLETQEEYDNLLAVLNTSTAVMRSIVPKLNDTIWNFMSLNLWKTLNNLK